MKKKGNSLQPQAVSFSSARERAVQHFRLKIVSLSLSIKSRGRETLTVSAELGEPLQRWERDKVLDSIPILVRPRASRLFRRSIE